MNRLLGIRANTEGTYRTEELFGTEYYVVPVVALVEGVLRGMASEGPELALADEFGLFPSGWNGRPLVMDHPLNEDGTPVSANSPTVLTNYQIGWIFNAQVKDKKLTLEAWVEKTRASSLNVNSKGVLQALEAGEMIEVSTGYFAQIEDTIGVYEGEEYEGVQRNIVPDHLAFLSLGSTGACSNEDGCGAPRINANSKFKPAISFRVNCEECGGTCQQPKGPATMTTAKPKPAKPTSVPAVKPNITMVPAAPISAVTGGQIGVEKVTDELLDPAAGGNGAAATPKANDQYATVENYDYLTIEGGKMKRKAKTPQGYSRGQAALDLLVNSFPDGMMDFDAESFVQEALESDPETKYPYVIGLTQSKVIYSAYDENYDYDTYQRSYTVADGGKVTLGDDVQEIMLTTSIVIMDRSSETVSANSKGSTPEDNKERPMANGKAPEAAPQANSAPTPAVHTVENDQGTLEVTMDAEGKPSAFKLTPKVNAAPAPAASLEQLLANAAPELRESIQSGVKLHATRKTGLIKALKDSGRCKFEDSKLQAMSMDDLENLAELASVPTFIGQALPGVSTSLSVNEDAAPPAPLVFEAKPAAQAA